MEPLADKWRAFGWAAREVDRHHHAAALEELRAAEASSPYAYAGSQSSTGGLQ